MNPNHRHPNWTRKNLICKFYFYFNISNGVGEAMAAISTCGVHK